MSQRILVVDDDSKLLDMLRRILAFAGYQVETADNGRKALASVLESEPDLVVLDWMLPELTGLDVCRRLRSATSVRILMLTAKDTVDDRVTGLQTGADDYLVKPFAAKELLARIEALLRREQKPVASKPDVYSFADATLDTGSREATRAKRRITLTTTEYELLLLFMRHPRQVLTRDILMERVWGYDFSQDSNVLEVYIGYLRRKLEENDATRLIYTVRGAGYVMRESA